MLKTQLTQYCRVVSVLYAVDALMYCSDIPHEVTEFCTVIGVLDAVPGTNMQFCTGVLYALD